MSIYLKIKIKKKINFSSNIIQTYLNFEQNRRKGNARRFFFGSVCLNFKKDKR